MYFNVFVLSIYTYYMNILYISQSLFKCVCVYVNEYIIYILLSLLYIHIYNMTILHTHTVLVFTVTWFSCHLETFILQWQRPW